MLVPEPVPVSMIVSPRQHFRCVPYSATITAAVCVERQASHDSKIAISAWGTANPDRVAPHAFRRAYYGTCADCELGRRVKAALRITGGPTS